MEENKRQERDLSPTPSAHSQCSTTSTGLEWDPSADVGSSENIHGHRIPPQFKKNRSDYKSDSEESSVRRKLTRSEIEFKSKKSSTDKSESDESSVVASIPKTKQQGDSHSLTDSGMTRSEIEYQKKRSFKDKLDSDGSSGEASTHSTHPSGSGEITRSEIEYQKKKAKDKSLSDGSSVMWVEVQQNIEHRTTTSNNNSKTLIQDSRGSNKSQQLKDIGIQTSDLNVMVEGSGLRSIQINSPGDLSSNVYHSTPNEEFRSNRSRMRENRSKDVRSDGEKEMIVFKQLGEKRRGRSPPQPFVCASRRSSHRCHDAHHSRISEISMPSLMDTNTTTTTTHTTTATSSSDLSPPCFLIDKLVKSGKSRSPAKKHSALTINAIEVHRDYHVKKVRHELKQLEKLNELLSKTMKKKSKEHTSTDLSEKEEIRKKSKRNSPTKQKVSSPAKSKPVQSNLSTSVNTTTSTTNNTSTKDSSNSSAGTYTVSQPNPSILKGSGVSAALKAKKEELIAIGRGSQDPLEKKLDQIINTFSVIADMFLKNKENIPSSNKTLKDSKAALKKVKKVKKPKQEEIQVVKVVEKAKPAVSYFINFSEWQKSKNFVIQEEICKDQIKAMSPTSSQSHHVDEDEENISESSEEEEVEGICNIRFTLQDAFQHRNPAFLKQLQEREQVLKRIKAEREVRTEKKREWVRKYGESARTGYDLQNPTIPPKGPRLMTTKEMREQTERKYKNLPEVREKVLQRKAEVEKRTNRLMSQVFANRLRHGVLKGEVNIVHNKSLICR